MDEVTRRNDGRLPIIVGHSIGGGVAQVYAADSFLRRKISGVGLLAGFPPNVADAARVLGGMASAVAKERFRYSFSLQLVSPPIVWVAFLGYSLDAVGNSCRDVLVVGLLGEGVRCVAPTPEDYRRLMGSAETRSSGSGEAGGLSEDRPSANGSSANRASGTAAGCVGVDAVELELEHLRLERSASWVLPLQVMLDLSSKRGQLQRSGDRLPCVVLGGAEDERLVGAGVLERTAAYYGVSAVRVPGAGHAMMARAGGDWDAAGRALLQALRASHEPN